MPEARATVQEATAQPNDLGRRWRTYRQRQKTAAPAVGGIAGMVVGLVVLANAEAPLAAVRTWAVLIPLGLLIGMAYNYFAEIAAMHGRLWLTVYDEGVLIRHDYGTTVVKPVELTAGKWEAVHTESPNLQLLWPAPASAGKREATPLDVFGSSRSLRKALAGGAPSAYPLRSRIATCAGLVLAATAFYVWVFVPFPVLVPEDPEHLAQFCADPEMIFAESPRYEGSGPHYLEEWVESPNVDWRFRFDDDAESERDRGWSTDMADAALIACGRTLPGEELRECGYTDNAFGIGEVTTTLHAYAVAYEFGVYEAATHDRVGEATVVPAPEDDAICPEYIAEDRDRIEEYPTEEQVAEALAPFVEGDADN